jgi:hypothetical protein
MDERQGAPLFARPVVDATEYPREYRTAGFWRYFLLATGAAFIAGGAIGAWFALAAFRSHPRADLFSIGLAAAAILIGASLLWSLKRDAITLYPDRMVIQGLCGTKTLYRAHIRGWRLQTTSPPMFIVERLPGQGRRVTIGLTFKTDEVFLRWMDGVPCLDVEDARASAEELANLPSLGATAEERIRSLKRWRQAVWLLNGSAVVASGWGLFWPRPYAAAIGVLIGVPWVAVVVVARSRGVVRTDEFPNDSHPNVAAALIFPGAALALRGIRDFQLVSMTDLLPCGLAIGVLLVAAECYWDASLRRSLWPLVAFSALTLVYGCSAGLEANCLLEQSAGVGYEVVVNGMHSSSGKYESCTLEVGPWGPRTEANELEVTRGLFSNVRKGDSVRVVLYRGALHMPWYRVERMGP